MPLTQQNIKKYASTGNLTSHVITLGFTPTANNLLVVALNCDDLLGSPPVADNIDTAGTGWHAATSATNNTVGAIYYRIAGGSETTVTIKMTGSFAAQADVIEYSGNVTTVSAVLDIANSASGSSAAPATPSVTTTNADDLVIVLFGVDAFGGLGGLSATYTLLDNSGTTGSTTNDFMLTGTRAVSATGAQSASCTASSNAWVACIAAFKAAAAGAFDPSTVPWPSADVLPQPYAVAGF